MHVLSMVKWELLIGRRRAYNEVSSLMQSEIARHVGMHYPTTSNLLRGKG